MLQLPPDSQRATASQSWLPPDDPPEDDPPPDDDPPEDDPPGDDGGAGCGACCWGWRATRGVRACWSSAFMPRCWVSIAAPRCPAAASACGAEASAAEA